MSLSGQKSRYDDVIATMYATDWFRVTEEGHIKTCYRWLGTHEGIVPWRRCDKPDGKGYMYVSFHQSRVKAHRLAYMLYTGKPLEGLEINHIDGDKTNNRRENLELCTASRQSQHAFDIGLNRARGEGHPKAKFKDGDIVEIRRLRKIGVPYTRLAATYSVTPAAVRFICIRHTWKHVV